MIRYYGFLANRVAFGTAAEGLCVTGASSASAGAAALVNALATQLRSRSAALYSVPAPLQLTRCVGRFIHPRAGTLSLAFGRAEADCDLTVRGSRPSENPQFRQFRRFGAQTALLFPVIETYAVLSNPQNGTLLGQYHFEFLYFKLVSKLCMHRAQLLRREINVFGAVIIERNRAELTHSAPQALWLAGAAALALSRSMRSSSRRCFSARRLASRASRSACNCSSCCWADSRNTLSGLIRYGRRGLGSQRHRFAVFAWHLLVDSFTIDCAFIGAGLGGCGQAN